MDIPIPFICVFPVQVLSIVLVTYLYYKALLTMIMTPKGVASNTLFIYHIQSNCRLPSVLFGRQNTPIDFVHGISHAHELNYSTNKKKKITFTRTFHKYVTIVYDGANCRYQYFIRCRYSSNTYPVITYLLSNVQLFITGKGDSNTHTRAVRTCFIFKCQYCQYVPTQQWVEAQHYLNRKAN